VKQVLMLVVVALGLSMSNAWAADKRYAEKLCDSLDYDCITIKSGDSWERLWPDDEQRDIVRRVNRMNTRLHSGMKIAVPQNLAELTIYDVAPFPRYVDPTGEKTIFVSQKELAWGAYDAEGELVWWGPISSGKSYCSDIGASCKTPGGNFRIIRKQDISCISTAFPRRRSGANGGAPMPYCMHFFRGYALHGSTDVPGRRDSHGCIRLFIEDAQWLNQEFIELPGRSAKGTRIIVESVN
jgi:L,D-transpeptidase catalytic domain